MNPYTWRNQAVADAWDEGFAAAVVERATPPAPDPRDGIVDRLVDDLDGIVADTEDGWREAVYRILDERLAGLQAPPVDDAYPATDGPAKQETLAELIAQLGDEPPEELDELIAEQRATNPGFRRAYDAIIADRLNRRLSAGVQSPPATPEPIGYLRVKDRVVQSYAIYDRELIEESVRRDGGEIVAVVPVPVPDPETETTE